MKQWTRKTAAKFWNMPDNRVKYFVEYKKIVIPDKPGIGQGNPSYFNATNMVELGIAECLGRYGLAIGAIGAIQRVFKLLRVSNQEHKSIFESWTEYDKLYLFIFGSGLLRQKNEFILWTHPKIDFHITEAKGKAAMKNSNSVLIIDLGSIFRKVKTA